MGIPTAVDRVIQQAIAQVLGPMYEPQFSEGSFGFRPGRSAHDALRMIAGSDYHGENVCYVSQLRTPLLLKNLDSRDDLVSPELRVLAEHDRKKGTQYCETLYLYLIYSRSLKKTCDAVFTHRNTVLYRIERIRDDFLIPLDDPERHAELLFGVAILLFQKEGPDFFLRTMPQTDDE